MCSLLAGQYLSVQLQVIPPQTCKYLFIPGYCLGAKEIFVSVCVLAVYIHLPQLIKVRQDSTGIEVVRDHAASGSQAGPNIRLDEKPGLCSLSGQKPCQSQITLRYAVLQTVKECQ